jgi:hypothetical protein
VERRLRGFRHDAPVVQHQHVDAGPRAAHAELRHQVVYWIGSRRDQDIPALQDRRQSVDIDEVRVYQHFARRQWHNCGVDVHRAGASALELMEVQPLGRRGDGAASESGPGWLLQVTNRSRPQRATVGGIEHRLEFIGDVVDRFLGFRDPIARVV